MWQRKKTIPIRFNEQKLSADTLALNALVWILQDGRRAERLLALTGLTADDLRAGVTGRRVQAAVLEFLAGNEADLLAAADALNVSPTAMAMARQELSR